VTSPIAVLLKSDDQALRAASGSMIELSAREVEVLQGVADGRSNGDIAAELRLSPLTVKSHLARIGRKLGTGDRAHAVLLALRAGVIT
jgi:DNA-binding NarL/FixJ family response regulator